MERDLKVVLASFEKAKEWEWSDLIQWIKRIQTIVDGLTLESFPDALTLEKRIWQCLNPALPQGLHALTLKIYQSILLKKNLTNQDYVLFLTGLLPYFQYSSSENRIQVISILDNSYKERIKELKLVLLAVVIAVLPGLDQDSNQDVGRKTFDLLDEFALRGGQSDLFYCVWKALLTTPKVRLGALTYLKARIQPQDEESCEFTLPKKVLVVNAIRAALRDYEVLVRRNCMDLLIDHFPIDINEEIVTFKEKILIIQEVLMLFLKEDNHTIRRIWKWMIPDETDEDLSVLSELLIEAMKEMMSSERFHKDEPIIIYKVLLEKNQLADPLMRELSVPLLMYTEEKKEDPLILDKCISLLKAQNSVEREELIWNSLTYFFEENLHSDLGKSINIISQYFEISSNIEYVQSLFENILINLHNLSNKELKNTIELAIRMLPRFESQENIDLKEAVRSYYEFFISLASQDNCEIENFRKASLLAVQLHKYSENELDWLKQLTNISKSSSISLSEDMTSSILINDHDFFIVKCQAIIELYKNGAGYVKDFLQTGKVLKRLIKKLWDVIQYKDFSKECARLLIQVEQIDSQLFVHTIKHKLDPNENFEKHLIANIQTLVLFWNLVSKYFIENLANIYGNRVIANEMVNHLDSLSPLVRYHAVKWLDTVLSNLGFIIEPILSELLSNIENEDLDSLEVNLKDLKNILKNGLRKCVFTCDSIVTSTDLVEKIEDLIQQNESLADIKLFESSNNFDTQNSILQILIKVPFAVLLTNWVHIQPQKRLKVKVSACEFLSIILQKPDTQIAYYAANAVLFSLKWVQEGIFYPDHEDEIEIIHFHLQNIINIIIFDCNLLEEKKNFIKLVESEIFSTVYVQGLKTRSDYIQGRWSEFITETFEIIAKVLKPEDVEILSIRLIKKFCSELNETNNKKHLIKGLQKVIHCNLKTLEKRETEVKDWIGFVINKLIDCCGPYQTALIVKTTGTEFIPDKDSVELQDSEEIIGFIRPLMEKEAGLIIKSCFEVWYKTCIDENPNEETNEKLKKIVGLIVTLNVDLASIINGFTYTSFLMSTGRLSLGSQVLDQEDSEIEDLNVLILVDKKKSPILCHFLYTLFCVLPPEHFKYGDFWESLVNLFKDLERFDQSVIKLWVLEIIHLILQKIASVSQEKSYFPIIYEYVQRTLVSVTRLSLSNNEEVLERPNPPSLNFYDVGHKLNTGALITLKFTLYDIVLNLWKGEQQEKLVSQFTSYTGMMIQAITTKSDRIDIQLTSELLAQIFATGRMWLARTYRKEIIEFLTSPNFFKTFNVNEGNHVRKDFNSLKAWGKIISCVSNECYGDRYSLINELFNKMFTGFFTRSTNNSLRAHSIRTVSFVIYSGSRDEYQSCTQMICEKLIEFIKTDDENLRSAVYHCTIVLILRLSSESLNNLWPRLWPHLFTDIWQIFTDPSTKESLKTESKKSLNSILNLLDVLITLMNQDFQIFKPMLYYDNTQAYLDCRKEENSDVPGFRPLKEQLVSGKPFFKEGEVDDEDEVYKTHSRSLILDESVPADDLNHKIRKMIRDSMRKSESIFMPSLESVDNLIEKGFFN